MGLFSDFINDRLNTYHNLVDTVVDTGIKVAGTIASTVQGIVEGTLYNTITSSVRNAANSFIGQVTNFNPAFLQDTTPIVAPVDQDLNKTPTVSEFMQAATSVYGYKAIPDGASPFLYNNQQLGIVDSATGMASKVWVTAEKQIIISYQGTTGGITLLTNPLTALNQVVADVGVAAGTVTPGEENAVKFAQFVVGEAQKQGYSTKDIFVTGHSLGGIEAEYVAQQTGLGGIGFNATGIPISATAKGDGSNFVNVLQYGDPVSSYASDVQGEQSLAPAYDPNGGELPHYGQKVFVGSIEDQSWLSNIVSNQWDSGTVVGKLAAASQLLGSGFSRYHLPWHAASNLGVDLGLKTFAILNGQAIDLPLPTLLGAGSAIAQAFSPVHGAVLNVGDNTIQQFLTADSQRTDYHSSALPTPALA